MPRFKTTRSVPFSARQMFDLVADIERYPEFLPLCEGLTVHARDEHDGITHLAATMDVGYGAIKESFATKVFLNPTKQLIDVSYVDGPFKHLASHWEFTNNRAGSEVGFFIDYEFRSLALGLVMGTVFEKAFKKFAQSFEERAHTIYAESAARS